MPNTALATVQELLNEEKWTRAAIENYSRKNFIRLDNLITTAIKEGDGEELLKVCQEHHKHSPHSIISLYIMGILKHERKDLDDRDLNEAITLFRDNKKWAIVQFLAERILDYGESVRALKHLAAVYQHMNMEEDLWRTWERLVRVDHDNFEVARKIAAHYEADNRELAIYYHKIALRRILQQKSFSQLDQIWKKLVELDPDDLDFFMSIEARLKGKMNDNSIGNLFMELVPFYQDKNVDTALQILQLVLAYSPENQTAREQMILSLRDKYEKHSRLAFSLAASGLEDFAKPVTQALEVFFRNIAFDIGDSVYHRSWGIGAITAIDDETFTIDFDKKGGHKMNIEMAIKSLVRLTDDHLWIMAKKTPDTLRQLAEDNPPELLRMTLASFDRKLALKDLKEHIIASGALTEAKWTAWWNRAKKVFKTDPKFGTSPDKKNIYFLRDKPMTFEEDSLNRFEAEKDFNKKLLILEDFLNHASGYGSQELAKMVGWFCSKIEGRLDNVDADELETIIFLQRLKKTLATRTESLEIKVPELEAVYPRIKNPADLFTGLLEMDSKKTYLMHIRKHSENWDEIYLRILQQPTGQYHTRILDELTLNDRNQVVDEFLNGILEHYRDDTDHLTWLAKVYFEREGREDQLRISKTNLIAALINSMSRLDKDIENKTNVAVNRKRFNFIRDTLFKEGQLALFIEKTTRADAEKIIRLIPQISGLVEEQDLQAVSKALSQAHEGLQLSFAGEGDVEEVKIHPFLVTEASLLEKQKEFKHIMEVEIPKNSQDISLAVEKGDLSENAEYKAALEHQEQLKARIAQLDDELKTARVVEDQDITIDHVGFGTRVLLVNLDRNSEETLTILGEWESNPGKKVISYKSPLGNTLLFKKAGEEFAFEAGGNTTRYRIKGIEKAELD